MVVITPATPAPDPEPVVTVAETVAVELAGTVAETVAVEPDPPVAATRATIATVRELDALEP